MTGNTGQTPPGPRPEPELKDEPYFGSSARDADLGGNGGLKLAVIALAIVGATTVALALIFRSVDGAASARSGQVTTAISEQTRIMREAVQMAKEAQEMNRQRMREMQRAMEEADGSGEYGGYYSDP
jgi:hypothetical protein